MFNARPVLTASCLLFAATNLNAQVICSTAASDSDGDGWGWENGTTCIVSADIAATETTSLTETQPLQQSTAPLSLEEGTPIAAFAFSNADISNGYAVITPQDANATGLIFSRSGGIRWTERASVSVPDFEIPDQLEESLGVFAISDKYAVVGVPGYYASSAGSAHIFERVTDNQWVLDTVLNGPTRPFDFFGKSVALSGDTLAVGSNPGGEAEQPGRVTIYTNGDDGWTLDQSIDSSSTLAEPDRFGDSILLNENFMVVSHQRRGVSNADIYQRNPGGWSLHSIIRGEIFALEQNTIVAAEAGVLSTYILDVNNSFQIASTIEYPNRTITSLALSEQRLLVAFDSQSSVDHYLRAADSSWQIAGQIDGLLSIFVPADRLFLTLHGISGQSVIISRGAFPENSTPLFDTYIVDLPDYEATNIVADTTDSESDSGMDNSEQVEQTTGAEVTNGVDQDTAIADPTVTGECIDNDGDGYGWNGVDTCFPNESMPAQDIAIDNGIDSTTRDPACIDSDGDGYGYGYGWDGFQTCLVATPENVSTPVDCFDADGDGFGWTGTQSCSFNSDGSITLL